MDLQKFTDSIVATVGPWIPRLLAALVTLLVLWIIGRVVRAAVSRLGKAVDIDGRLKSQGLTATFANLGYWLVWLIGMPILLGTLGLGEVLAPVTNLVNGILGFVPNLIGAAVVLGIGFLVAKVLRQVVTSLLQAAGSEKLAERLGMANSLGEGGLAGLVGMVLFVLIMLPVVAAGLQPLGLDAVTRPVTAMIDTIIALIPRMIGAAIVMSIAVVLGRIVSNILTSLLGGLGFNTILAKLGVSQSTRVSGRTPAELAGTLVFAGILLAALTQASDIIGFSIFTAAIGQFGVAAVAVFTGLVVFGVGLWLSNVVAGAIRDSSLANRTALALVARAAVIFFTVPMALRQMGLPSEIVSIGFGMILGALAIAAAIAFGIGGRDVARRVTEQAFGRLSPDAAQLSDKPAPLDQA